MPAEAQATAAGDTSAPSAETPEQQLPRLQNPRLETTSAREIHSSPMALCQFDLMIGPFFSYLGTSQLGFQNEDNSLFQPCPNRAVSQLLITLFPQEAPLHTDSRRQKKHEQTARAGSHRVLDDTTQL